MPGWSEPGPTTEAGVTNSVAIALLALILGFFLLDALVLHQGFALQLARTFVRFIEWVSFWR